MGTAVAAALLVRGRDGTAPAATVSFRNSRRRRSELGSPIQPEQSGKVNQYGRMRTDLDGGEPLDHRLPGIENNPQAMAGYFRHFEGQGTYWDTDNVHGYHMPRSKWDELVRDGRYVQRSIPFGPAVPAPRTLAAAR